MAEILRTTGEREPFDLGAPDARLRTMQAAVGGYIEMIPLAGGAVLVLNEEGKLHGLPFNALATPLLHEAGGAPTDYVVGDALVCQRGELNDEPEAA